MKAVGVIGVGLMGLACVSRLVRAKHEVLAYDIDPTRHESAIKLGARAVTTVGELVNQCGVIILAVFNTRQVEAVIEEAGGILDGAAGNPASPIVICVSTCDPDRLASLTARSANRGLRFIEAPISGTSRQVMTGDGVGLVGGDPALLDEAALVLEAICPKRHYLGAVGNGSRAKLAVNLILGLNRAAIAEGLVFAERLGLAREDLLKVARESAAYSSVMETKGVLMARRDFTNPQSRVDQSLKDFHLMLQAAKDHHQELPFATVYAELLEDCVKRGQAELDNAVIVEAIASRQGS